METEITLDSLQETLESNQRVAQDLDKMVLDTHELISSEDSESYDCNNFTDVDPDLVNREGMRSQLIFLLCNGVDANSILKNTGL